VLTVVGDDRSGLVRALSDVIAERDGNWEESQFAELAGKFAGVVVVSVPDERTEALSNALAGLGGLLEVTPHPVREGEATTAAADRQLTIHLIGNDRPGIVREVSATLEAHGLSIARMETLTRPAPMAGGTPFEAGLTASVPDALETASVRDALEALAAEILVDLTVDEEPED
jgi:glycine cleavage system regulatory protein